MQSSTTNFEDKKKRLFECLENAEKSVKGILEQPPFEYKNIPTIKNKKQKINVLKFRGRESIFKKPDLPIEKCLKSIRAPDYKINKSKWTKYSLDDVDMTDKSNTLAAISFLASIEAQKTPDKDEIFDSINDKDKIVFHKSISLKCKTSDNLNLTEKPIMLGSKVIMPEFNFNKKKLVKKDNKKSHIKKITNELKLDHLLEETDE